nr:hypothetical protein [Tanacetum cinerariifolium]
MAPLTFADTHSMLAFLTKSNASEGFDQIVDFLNAHTIQYALMVNPTIFVLCIKQFWASVSIKKSNDIVKLQALIDRKKTCATLTKKVANLEQDKVAQVLEIVKLKERVGRLEKKRRTKHSSLKRLKKVGTSQRVESSNDTIVDDQEDASKQEGKFAKLDANKDVTLVDDTDEVEPAEVEEVLEVVTGAKLMTELVTTTAPITTAAQVPKASAPRKRRGVVMQDHEEIAAASVDNTVMMYPALNRNPLTEAQARKNMIIYLKKMVGFKMDLFKGMTYSEIRPIFEKHYNSIQAFLEKGEKEIKEERNKRKGENIKQDTTKKQRIDKDAEELKRHLHIVVNDDDDDVYIEATPLASKVPVVDYQIYHQNNKPYYKIIRADGTHKLFLSFITLLKNFDKEDLETLWKLVKERFESTEPKNFSDDFLLNTLKIMFEKPNVEANVWRDQKSRYGLAKKYPLTYFTLEKMLNNMRLEVEEESEMSLELLRTPVKILHKVLHILTTIVNIEPCHNQNVDEFPQSLPSFHPKCYSGDENSFAYDSNPNFVDDSPNIFNPPPQPLTDSYEFCRNDAHYSHDCPTQFPVIHQPPQETSVEILHDHENVNNSVQTFLRKFNRFSFFKTPKNHPAFYNYDDDDDEDYVISITPVLSIEEPVDSLILEDEHLDTISATESNEVIKSSVEDLVLIPSESEGIPDNMCDVPFCDSSLPLDISKDQFKDFSDSNDDSTSIDDDYFSIDDIDYVEAWPPNFELISLKEVKDDILRDKLLNIYLLIDKIESLNVNPTPDRVLKSPSLFPILVEDIDSSFEKSDTSLSYSDNCLLEFNIFNDHTKETSSGSTTTHADNSLPNYDSFLFEIEPDQGELPSIFMEDILGEPQVHVPNVLPTYPTLMLDPNFIPSDNSLPESKIFCFDIEEKNSVSTTIHADISPSDFDHFHFKIEPDPGEFPSIVDSRICENVLSATNLNLSTEDDQSPLFAYVVWIFLPFIMYSVAHPYLLSFENEDAIFDPDIAIYHSFMPGVSHRSGTFMKFNVYPNHLNEIPMEILPSTCFPMDQ